MSTRGVQPLSESLLRLRHAYRHCLRSAFQARQSPGDPSLPLGGSARSHRLPVAQRRDMFLARGGSSDPEMMS
jgi:hypothetical protein